MTGEEIFNAGMGVFAVGVLGGVALVVMLGLLLGTFKLLRGFMGIGNG